MNAHLVMYQLFLRPFTAGGTLADAEKLLPNIASLGVDVVYLCPITTADPDMDREHWSNRQKLSGIPNPRNPYRVWDYNAVDPEYGTEEDLAHFVQTAHKLGLRVMLDLVYYHCGPSAPLLQEHPDYCLRNEDGSIRWGDWHFPALNFGKEGLREYLWQNMEHFVRDFDVDGYRCDVGDMVPLDFWMEGARRIRAIKPDALLLNEGKKPEYMPAFDMTYGFYWIYALDDILRGDKDCTDLRQIWEEQHALFGEHPLLRGYDNHDVASDSYNARVETVGGFERVNAALFSTFTFDGTPFLYNGCEICDTRRHSIFSNRDFGGNYVIQWENALTEQGRRRMQLIGTLTGLYHSESALHGTQLRFIDTEAPKQVLAYVRGESLLAAVNLSRETVTVTLPETKQSLLSYGATRQGNSVTLAQGGYLLERL